MLGSIGCHGLKRKVPARFVATMCETVGIDYEDFADSFFGTPPPGLPPLRDDADHTIELVPGAAPVFLQMFRLSRDEGDAVKENVTDLLRNGLIGESSSPFGAAVFFVSKKDGSKRMVID